MPSSDVCSRSEEHTSELQSHDNLVCRLLLEKKKHTIRGNLAVRTDVVVGVAPEHRALRVILCALCAMFLASPGGIGVWFLLFFFLKERAPPEFSPFPLPPPFRI